MPMAQVDSTVTVLRAHLALTLIYLLDTTLHSDKIFIYLLRNNARSLNYLTVIQLNLINTFLSTGTSNAINNFPLLCRITVTVPDFVSVILSHCETPLVYKKAVYGLYAWSYNCLSDPAVYVDVPSFVDWVKNTI
ncbi:hypothetical protein J6590_059498 [Homalodisca vitripennis]|nr:hypothetical protein J6590_059498 [Homalodisca vitripennis]